MSLSGLAIRRPIFLTSVVIVTLLVGVLCLFRLGVDNFPDVTFPVVVTTVVYPGASPQEIETLVAKPIENEVSTVSGLKRLYSTNQEGLCTVVAEFTLGTDVKYAEQLIRDKVSNVRTQLPKEIDPPTVNRIDVSDQPIMEFSLAGDLPGSELYDLADLTVRPMINQVNDVGNLDILGESKREIKVEVDRTKLKRYELSIQGLADRISASAKNVPVGKVVGAANETVFRAIGEYSSIDKINDTVVNFFGSEVPVKVGDVASVKDSQEDEKTRSFLDGKHTVFISAHKQSGANTVAVAEALEKKMDEINKVLTQKKGGVKLSLVRDGARFIRANVEDVKSSILMGIVLAVLVVFLFLGNIRSTLITGLALPNSLLGAFILMYLMGFTINIMTLLALSLAVGLLIDDAIVVRENIFRRLEEGEDPKEAAESGTEEVTLAVIATTLTVIAVFLPVGFLSGTVGQFFKQFGLTIVFAMAISLFDALTMAPMLSAYFAGKNQTEKGIGKLLGHLSNGIESFHLALARYYGHVLKFSLRRPWAILLLGVGVFVFSIFISGQVKKTFIPNSDNGEFAVNIEMPAGTNLDATQKESLLIQDIVTKHKEVDRVALTVGNTEGESNVAQIYVGLTNYKLRSIMTNDLKDIIREELKPFAVARPKVSDIDITGNSQQPFNVVLAGENLDEMDKVAQSILAKFKKIPGLVDLDTNYRLGKPEFQIKLLPEKIEKYGVVTGMAGDELRGLMEGIIAGKYREGGQEYNIRVRLQPEERDLQKYFNETYVPNINNNLIKVSDVSTGQLTQGPSKISRYNRSRMIEISGDLAPDGALGNIREDAEKILKAEDMKGISYSFLGQSEDFQDLIINMVIAIGLAVIFVYLILSSLYESFITPFTIMLALPLASAGAFFALYLTKQSLNLFSMIGLIMLLGLVTKNSILLVDYALQLMRKGKTRDEALMESGLKRLRPILMTTVALIAGTLPVALGLSEAARSRSSMGITIIGGLITSTLLTLVVVPAAFGYIDRFRAWSAGFLGGIFLAKPNAKPKTHSNGHGKTSSDKEVDAHL